MIPTSLITIQNAIILWNMYHYYVYADSIYKGVYYTSKVINISKNVVEYVFINNNKTNENENENENENGNENEDDNENQDDNEKKEHGSDEWVIL